MPKQTIYNKVYNQTFPIKTYKQGRNLRWRYDEVIEYIENLRSIQQDRK
jgi:predicted DNA-binding transcriptional regulator AlpA